MFDFTPVGLAVAAVGVAVRRAGRLAPRAGARAGGIERLRHRHYLTEARVTKDSKAAGKTLREIESGLDEAGAQVVAWCATSFAFPRRAHGGCCSRATY
jgi:hypothetical protein